MITLHAMSVSFLHPRRLTFCPMNTCRKTKTTRRLGAEPRALNCALFWWFRHIAKPVAGISAEKMTRSTSSNEVGLPPPGPDLATQNATHDACHHKNIMHAEDSFLSGAMTTLPSGFTLRYAASSKTHHNLERSGELQSTRNSSEATRKAAMDMIPCCILPWSV